MTKHYERSWGVFKKSVVFPFIQLNFFTITSINKYKSQRYKVRVIFLYDIYYIQFDSHVQYIILFITSK